MLRWFAMESDPESLMVRCLEAFDGHEPDGPDGD
jgi:hypothetical protein